MTAGDLVVVRGNPAPVELAALLAALARVTEDADRDPAPTRLWAQRAPRGWAASARRT